MPLSKAAAKRASFAQLSLFVLISGLPPSHAATNVVSNTSDSGPGSLRQAILDSNNSGGGDTIIFSNTLSGTITLRSGELVLLC